MSGTNSSLNAARVVLVMNSGAYVTASKGRDDQKHMLHGMASAGTVAWVMYQKYVNCHPLYRQEKDFKMYGAEICRGTIANWIINNAEDFIRPMHEYFQRKLVSGKYIMADETPVQVLKEPGRRAETKSYMWVFRSGEYDPEQIVLFHYSPTRAGQTAKVIRYILPKGKSFDSLSQKDVNLMMIHINNYPRKSLNERTPYDFANLLLGKDFLQILHIHRIDPDRIILKPSLLQKKHE